MTESKDLIPQTYDLPAVPAVAIKILKLIDDPFTSLDDVQRVIVADQSLATTVLKMANSAFYGSSHKIDTITDAVAVMGLNTIKMLTLAVSTREVYRNFGIIEQKLWEHGLGVSVASGIIANEFQNIKREEAVIAGLLHDIGKTIMNNSQPERFLLLTQRIYEERLRYEDIEHEYFGFNHSEVGALLAEKWEFPQILCDVIKNHHNRDFYLNNDGQIGDLCSIVALSDSICVRLGIGYRGPMADIDLDIDELREKMGINNDRFEKIINVFKNAYIEEKKFYMV